MSEKMHNNQEETENDVDEVLETELKLRKENKQSVKEKNAQINKQQQQ